MTEPTDGTSSKLRELAQNLWWSWQPDIRAIFRELDPVTWSVVYHNPVALLQRVPEDEIARRILAAHGERGPNFVYLERTMGQLKTLKIREPSLERVYAIALTLRV